MQTIYQYDSSGIATGISNEIADKAGCPRGWTRLEPPATQGEQVARFNGSAWVVLAERPAADLTAPRAARWESIKTERDRRTQTGGYKVGTKWFHSDTFSRTQQLGLVMMGANVPAVQWKTMDGSFVTMTQTLAAQIFAAAAAQDTAMFARAEVIKAQVDASQDPGSIDILSGWPEVFGG